MCREERVDVLDTGCWIWSWRKSRRSKRRFRDVVEKDTQRAGITDEDARDRVIINIALK